MRKYKINLKCNISTSITQCHPIAHLWWYEGKGGLLYVQLLIQRQCLRNEGGVKLKKVVVKKRGPVA
jgi:hypothetical protein